jgi:hypothetical protein
VGKGVGIGKEASIADHLKDNLLTEIGSKMVN